MIVVDTSALMAIRLQRPEAARKAMLGMIGDSHANISRIWQHQQA